MCYLDQVHSDKKRWLLIGIQLHTIIVPFLRKNAAKKLDQLWNDLKMKNKIDVQHYPNQLPSYQTTYLNYEAINNNSKVRGRNRQEQYDYNIKNSVDLSKLFIHETNMIKHTGFDDSCDASALLSIIINSSICPPSAKDSAIKVSTVLFVFIHDHKLLYMYYTLNFQQYRILYITFSFSLSVKF